MLTGSHFMFTVNHITGWTYEISYSMSQSISVHLLTSYDGELAQGPTDPLAPPTLQGLQGGCYATEQHAERNDFLLGVIK